MASSRARHDGCFIVLLSRKCVKPKTLSDQQVWGCDYDFYDNDDFDDDNEDNDDFDDDNGDDWKLFLCAVAVFYESILTIHIPWIDMMTNCCLNLTSILFGPTKKGKLFLCRIKLLSRLIPWEYSLFEAAPKKLISRVPTRANYYYYTWVGRAFDTNCM